MIRALRAGCYLTGWAAGTVVFALPGTGRLCDLVAARSESAR